MKYICGHAVWHVCHQIPFVQQCPRHACTLVWKCRACGAMLQGGYNKSLPGEPCTQCGAVTNSLRIDCSVGQQSVASQCAELCLLSESHLRPVERTALMDAAVDALGGFEEAAQVLQEAILRRWDASPIEHLRRGFPGYSPASFLADELKSCGGNGEVAGRLIVRDALVSVMGPKAFLTLQAASSTRPGDADAAELNRLAAAAGVPLGAVRNLLAALNVRDSAGLANIGYANLRRFVSALAEQSSADANSPIGSVVARWVDPQRLRREAARSAVSVSIAQGEDPKRGRNGALARHVAWLHRHTRARARQGPSNCRPHRWRRRGFRLPRAAMTSRPLPTAKACLFYSGEQPALAVVRDRFATDRFRVTKRSSAAGAARSDIYCYLYSCINY